MKISVLFTACLLLAGATSAVAQISNVIPGAIDVDPCGAQGRTRAGVGNPPPSIELSKPCPTATFAFAFADIISTLEGGPVSALTSAGFDIMNGTHCGAGAPRFAINLDADTLFVITLGCSGATLTDLGNGWTRVTYSALDIANGVIAAGGTPASIISDLYILFDEGNDTLLSAPFGTPGSAIIDNIMVNGAVFAGALAATATVPTLDDFALAMLAILLGLTGFFALPRR